jgi:ATPase family associated with various cellular activities (AAA)
MMTRHFNTAGPCQSDIHYMLSSLTRLPQLHQFIAQRNYFVIHAPRQIGKTTAIMSLAQELTASGQYAAIALSAEVGAPFSQDIDTAEEAILGAWQDTIALRLPKDLQPPAWTSTRPGQRIRSALQAWAQSCPKPLVVFIDEIDSLQDIALVSILRQLRDGYSNRPTAFPQSIGLIGMRDVRDYKVASGGSDTASQTLRERLQTASPFNIKVESLTMRGFYAEEVAELYQQHTDDTGQIFTPEAVQLVFDLTQGQPWLVNAIARQLTEVIAPEPSIVITPSMVEEAKEILIRRQDTHLDSLAERLREDRVKVIIEPILAGQNLPMTSNEDRQYLVDLGLLRRDPAGGLVVANPIYREVLPRVLAQGPQDSLPFISPTWLTPEAELDTNRLLHAFLDFWLQHGEALLQSASYPEIAPHLVLMAFLHRVINGGGTLEREYAIGRDRMDLCLRYGAATLGIEIKVWATGRADPLTKGLEELEGYLNRLNQSSGWLMIFDRRTNAPALEDRLRTELSQTTAGQKITVIRA